MCLYWHVKAVQRVDLLFKQSYQISTNNILVADSSWEVTWSSDGQQILRIWRNPNVLPRVHKIPPLFYTISQTNPVQISQFYILKIPFNIILPFTASSSKRFLSIMFSKQILECILFSPIHVTCLANTSVLDLILLKIFGQECTSFCPH